MKTIVIASKNKHKINEIGQMLSALAFTTQSLLDFPDYVSPEETGATFLENAHIKAQTLADYLQKNSLQGSIHRTLYILADDSGLSCKGLKGAPGVLSARFAGLHAGDNKNNQKLIGAFLNNSELSRAAHYTCAMVILLPDKTKKEIEERCYGKIVTEPKGSNGFGYDPYFFLEKHQRTMAELSPEEKNSISHRGKALRNLLKELKKTSKTTEK
ncbi:MAG: RdgB/HAM1 family non-canonical purine NTP pyrophosphatase [bacterium]|nr:RdgB/HAM1 family non-canonical purine NTP pyrophosphatase [bacterium]MBU1918550.1 RdgB/HAM1 family non-canonical purine NTP pyrophosphatase [bacterium]